MMLKKYLLILIGSLSLTLTVIKSGWIYSYGVGFWGANGHDGIWHIALAESLAKGNLNNPAFAGVKLQNYHLGFDILLAFLNKLTGIRMDTLYFQILPIIFALSIGLLTYWFTELLTNSKKSALGATFFTYFAGSFAYLIGRGESAFWSQQGISTLINPPYALSLIFILLGLISLLKYQKNHKAYSLVLTAFLFGILFFVKVYAGLLILFSLFVVAIYEQLNSKTVKQFGKIFLLTFIFSSVFYFPFNKLNAGLIKFQPFWFLETMMGLTDHVGWTKFGEAMLNYKSGHVWFKGIIAYGVAFLVFVIGNFATRFIFIKDIFKKLDEIKIFMLVIIAAGIFVPTFFVQSGTAWNTIQFMYYSLFFTGILAGISLSNLNTILIYIIIVATIPTTMLTLKDVYIPSRPPAKISVDEISALKFLSQQSDGIVLTYPFDELKAKEAENFPPRPLYLYTSTAYVSAFSKKQVYLEDEINLDITGFDWKSRKSQILNWYKESNEDKARQFLKDNNIKYIYWVKPQRALLGEGNLGLEKIFENKEVYVYVVK